MLYFYKILNKEDEILKNDLDDAFKRVRFFFATIAGMGGIGFIAIMFMLLAGLFDISAFYVILGLITWCIFGCAGLELYQEKLKDESNQLTTALISIGFVSFGLMTLLINFNDSSKKFSIH